MAADMFGDIPYRQAADSTNLTPAFDPQLQVYADLQSQLDSAITIFWPPRDPRNLGPSTEAAEQAELIYQGRDAAGLRAVYTAVAHSLKARLYMHTAEVNPAAYALALAEVPLGIASPADDFLWFHDLTATGADIWWQFNSARAGDLAPGAALVEIEKRRIAAGVEDGLRLAFYFTPATSGFFRYRPGARPTCRPTESSTTVTATRALFCLPTRPTPASVLRSTARRPPVISASRKSPTPRLSSSVLKRRFRPAAREQRNPSWMRSGPTGPMAVPYSVRPRGRCRPPCKTSWRRSTWRCS